MRNIEYFIKNKKNTQVRIVLIQYDMEMENLQISKELKTRFSGPDVFFTGFNVSSWRGTLDLSFLSDEAIKKIETKIREIPIKKKCSNGANMGMFSWDGSIRSCYLDYNNEYVFGNVKESNTIDLLLCDERKQFVDNIYDAKPWNNVICSKCLSPYNAADQDLILETASERLATKGSMWEVLKKQNQLNFKDEKK
ncbi:hypothetical protein MHK_000794 [Candidatus Magnetomorum sp. HK-1]|nr:hypothetical protein MHK_000794 [Candidatus Magnetomorum sp. HK-1]